MNPVLRLVRVLAAPGCACVGALFLAAFGYILFKNKPWAFGFYAENPYFHLVGGLALITLARAFWLGARADSAWRRQLFGKVILLLVSVALVSGAAEWGLRRTLLKHEPNSMEQLRALKAKGLKMPVKSTHPLAMIIEPSDDPQLRYELAPGLDLMFGHRHLITNKRGMRSDHDYTEEKDSGVIRIVGLGDSGMFGWNVEQGQDYMSVLEKNLNARGDGWRYDALNLGAPGYNSQQEVACLRVKGLAYHPDIVVVGWCDNDFSPPFFLLEKKPLPPHTSLLHNLLFHRKDFAALVYGVNLADQREFAPGHMPEVPPEEKGVAQVEGAFTELKKMSQESGFRVLVFGPMRKEAVQILDRAGLDYYNTREKIPRGKYPEEWAVHFMHPHPEGHRVLAECLEQELRDRGWLPSTPRE